MFIDTSVIMYAGGAEHPHRAACRRVLERVADRSIDAVTSTEVVQEILHRFAHGRRETGQRMARSVLDLFDDLIPVDLQSIGGAVGFYTGYPHLSARDVLHVATCVSSGISEIVSVDGGFDAVAEVRRIEPADLARGARGR
ncbi:MAG: type II toxin-antitoxin system VapC family toxin [Pseudonocardiaceae bacterium]